jgi:hypothetical protein
MKRDEREAITDSPWFCDSLHLMLFLRGGGAIDGHHLIVHVTAQLGLLFGLLQLLLQVGSYPNLAVHNGRHGKGGEAILQLNKLCAERKEMALDYYKVQRKVFWYQPSIW